MRADRTGAPEWITRRARKGGNPELAVGVMIGVLASMVALNMAGQAFKQSSTGLWPKAGTSRKQLPLPRSPVIGRRSFPGLIGAGA